MKWSLPSRWAFARIPLISPFFLNRRRPPFSPGARPLAVKQRPATTTTNFERSRQTEQSAVVRPSFASVLHPSLFPTSIPSVALLTANYPRNCLGHGGWIEMEARRERMRPTMEREAGPADKGSFSHSRSTSLFLCHNATELSISNHRQVASRSALASSGLN